MKTINDHVIGDFMHVHGSGSMAGPGARRLIKVKHIKLYNGERTLVFDKKDIKQYELQDKRFVVPADMRLPVSKAGLYFDVDAHMLSVNLDENTESQS